MTGEERQNGGIFMMRTANWGFKDRTHKLDMTKGSLRVMEPLVSSKKKSKKKTNEKIKRISKSKLTREFIANLRQRMKRLYRHYKNSVGLKNIAINFSKTSLSSLEFSFYSNHPRCILRKYKCNPIVHSRDSYDEWIARSEYRRDEQRTSANWEERLRNYSLSAINCIQAARCLLISRLDGSAGKRRKSNEDWTPEGECYATDTSLLVKSPGCAIDRRLIDWRCITGRRIKARFPFSSSPSPVFFLALIVVWDLFSSFVLIFLSPRPWLFIGPLDLSTLM